MTLTDSELVEVLATKLHPARFTAMSGKMAAIVGFIIGYRYTDPAITELVIDSGGMVLAQSSGDVGANDIIGSATDLRRNLRELAVAAGLTPEERRAFTRMQAKIASWERRPSPYGAR